MILSKLIFFAMEIEIKGMNVSELTSTLSSFRSTFIANCSLSTTEKKEIDN